jgi:ABC-type lipoprotein release transport system permease subunit
MKLKPIINLSWKNVWRNPVRSGVVVMAVVLGTWAGMFTSALLSGLSYQMIKNQLDTSTAHIQIHEASFNEENLPSYYIPQPDSIIQRLKAYPFVKHLSARSVVNGLASSPTNTYGVTIKGIERGADSLVSNIHTYIQSGNYLKSPTRNSVLIGEKLAQRLDVGLRSRMVLNFQDIEGNITASAFRVAGIYKSQNSSFDEQHVFVQRADLNRMLGKKNTVHEIALIVDNFKNADAYAQQIAVDSTLAVQSWGDISPALRYTDSMMDTMIYIFMTIIIIALAFGIVNTMLMAVLERTQELGMLMAIGVNKIRIFAMVMFETVFLTLVGVPIGMLLSWATISWVSTVGINLGAFSEGLEAYGMSTMLYPELPPIYYLNIGLLMVLATICASIFPSIKALKLNPVQAIRKV